MRGIDVSVYSGEVPVEKWRAVKAEGCELAVIGLFHGRTVNRYAAQQMRAAHEAGMLLAGYVLIAPWTGWSGEYQVSLGIEQQALELRGSLKFLAVDVEAEGVTRAMIDGALNMVVAAGLRPIIYTGGWCWKRWWSDLDFSHIPLWTAQYQPLPEMSTRLLDVPALYGGWTREKLVGWQYAGTTDLCGVSCDLNWFDDKFIKGEEPMAEFTKEQEDRIKEIVNWCGPGLEMQARLGVSRSLRGTEAAIMAGDWAALPGRLLTIKELAQSWHRWEE